MEAFFDVRLKMYDARKEYLIRKLTEEWEILDNKVRFILAVVHGKLVVSNRKKSDLLKELKDQGYKTFLPSKKLAESSESSSSEDDAVVESNVLQEDLDKGYDYLLSMKIWSLTLERVEALSNEKNSKRKELEMLMDKRPEDLWLNDLEELELALDMFDAAIEDGKRLEKVAQRRANVNRKGQAKRKVKKANSSDDESSEEDSDDDSYDEKPRTKKSDKKNPKLMSDNRVPSKLPSDKAVVKKAAPLKDDTLPKPAVVVKSSKPPAPAKASKPNAPAKKQTIKKRSKEEWDSDEESESEDESTGDSGSGSDESFEFQRESKAVKNAVRLKIAPKSKPQVDNTIDLISDDDDDTFKKDKKAAKVEAPVKKAVSKNKIQPKAGSVDASKRSQVVLIDDEETNVSSKTTVAEGGLIARLQAKMKAEALSKAPLVERKSVFDFNGNSESESEANLKFFPQSRVANALKPIAENKGKGVKRGKNPVSSPAVSGEAVSAPVKKPRKEVAVEKPQAPARVKKHNRIDDSDEETDAAEEPVHDAVRRSPKPQRTRKPVNFASYYESDNDDESDNEDSDF